MAAAFALLALAAVGAVQAAVTPTAPGPNTTFTEGGTCTLEYDLDTTGTWTNMTVSLMTGSNLAMVTLYDVETGVDGTTGDGTYSYTCPTVTPNADIYFLQFTEGSNASSATWTTRFTIAGTDGSTTDPTEETDDVKWGTGKLLSTGSSSTSSASSSASTKISKASDNSTSSAASASASGSASTTASSSASSSSSTSTKSSSAAANMVGAGAGAVIAIVGLGSLLL